MRTKQLCIIVGMVCFTFPALAQKITLDRNKEALNSWFRQLGYGMMIQWSIDVQHGVEISKTLPGSSVDFQEYYFNELPKLFNPSDFNPDKWAELASVAGMNYVIFSAKHHNGFCMWNTNTTPFNCMNSGYGKDVLKEVIEAFRRKNMAVGIYFSPDDYHMMYNQNLLISDRSPQSESTRNEALWELNKKQLNELLSNYGKIDILYIDEKSDWANLLVANYVWDLDPDIFISRGGIPTFDYKIPSIIPQTPWELSIPAGFFWQYTGNDHFKDPGELIDLLVDVRVNGGNLLLNISPDACGNIDAHQETLLRNTGLWLQVNREAVFNIDTWDIASDNDIRYSKSIPDQYVYAYVRADQLKPEGLYTYFLRPVKAYKNTEAYVLGQSEIVINHKNVQFKRTIMTPSEYGLYLSIYLNQFFNNYYNRIWVLKIKNANYQPVNHQ